MIRAADDGNVTTRAIIATAYRVHIARLANRPEDADDDPSEEAEAGALLDALDAAHEAAHRAHVKALFEALAKRSQG